MNDIYSFSGVITAPGPNPDINKFEGSLQLDDRMISLCEKHLLLQGTFLKSTDWTIGIVIYTGKI
jgi:hypothetical protein